MDIIMTDRTVWKLVFPTAKNVQIQMKNLISKWNFISKRWLQCKNIHKIDGIIFSRKLVIRNLFIKRQWLCLKPKFYASKMILKYIMAKSIPRMPFPYKHFGEFIWIGSHLLNFPRFDMKPFFAISINVLYSIVLYCIESNVKGK